MIVKELIKELGKYNQEAELDVVVFCEKHNFTLSWSGGEGVSKANAESVSFYVDDMCDKERSYDRKA